MDQLPQSIEADYLERLNDVQKKAVLAPDGPLLVLAGAGTGKTRVLTTRLSHMLITGAVRPHEVLAVTFTNKAAREMSERVSSMIGRPAQGLWLGTFHSIGVRFLRQHAELCQRKPGFTILDTDDQIRLIKQICQASGLDDKRWPARVLLGMIQRWKDKGYLPGSVPQSEQSDFAQGRSVELYGLYQDRLITLNAVDFGDLLLQPLIILKQNPDLLDRYQNRFRAILVDEYQDTNITQYLWLRLLAQQHKNITCVGDDDQSIYSWRGAEVGNILRFETDFPDASIIKLEQNYRSTGNILKTAGGLIAHNRARHGKNLWTEGDAGQPVQIASLWDEEEEARFIGDEIDAFHKNGGSLAQTAVLVRAGFQTRAFEERFVQMGLPYRVIGGPRFYERMEIRDAIAYLRLLVQPEDDLAFERIVNVPKRGVGEALLRNLHEASRKIGKPLFYTAYELVQTDELKARAKNALSGFLKLFESWRLLLQQGEAREIVERVLDESGYTTMWQNDKNPDAQTRLDNLKELVKAVGEFDTIGGFLEHVGLVMELAGDTDQDMTTVMTLHAAKGLEFDYVLLSGWEEGLFPSQRAIDEGGEASLEEERRLAYVGITRGRKKVMISYAANRRIYNQWASSIPSRFIEELPADHIEHLHRNPGLRPDRDMLYDDGPFSLRPAGRRSGFAKTIKAEAETIMKRPRTQYHYSTGQRVFHQKFGYGAIVAKDGNKLEIAFEKSGNKKIMDSFVEPAEGQ